ncbi:MAG: carboxylating nicotinate-nucleotide diphosphorylase [Bryobacteraceae bacterium]|nr:carboxylating nicotinate-nucleotide diphosphorylase [Bryobacterales bacterium]MEB2362939.1 carboxylating nicotinate-nucleotide diphosphorylase [Bryobacterales bacterium]NUN02186.1 carboxylating nicotinate-nucleotide diphosphorylase [Bryobacteraceae bacterium]
MFDVTHPEVVEAVRRALGEDIGPGDVTSEACVPAERRASGRFIARDDIIVAGIELLPVIYEMRGGVEACELRKASGDSARSGEVLANVSGNARVLLACERVSLNFLQRLSGVATLGRRYVEAVAGTKCRILDTRKTTPGLRRLEKMAAAAAGVTNHRMGLFDAILIKNNHIAAAGGITPALERASRSRLPVEIEVRTRGEIEEALAAGAKHLLLDNMPPEQAAEEIRHISGRATVELSGGINLESVRAFAEAGADFVSSGAITHSAAAVDINFRLDLI